MQIRGRVVDAAGSPAVGVSVEVRGFIAARVIVPIERGEPGGGPRHPTVEHVVVGTDPVVVVTDAQGGFDVALPTPDLVAEGHIQGRKTFGGSARALGPVGNTLAEDRIDDQQRDEVELSLQLPAPAPAFETATVHHELELRAHQTWRAPDLYPVGVGPIEVTAFTLKRTVETPSEAGTPHPVVTWEPDQGAAITVHALEGSGPRISGDGNVRLDIGLDDGGTRRAWAVTITNPSSRPARVSYQARFVSRRPIRIQRVTYADLEREISRLTQLGPHDTDEPPIRLVIGDPVRVIIRRDWQDFFGPMTPYDVPNLIDVRGGTATASLQIRPLGDDVAIVMRIKFDVAKIGASIPALLDVEATNLSASLTFRLGIERQQIVYRCDGSTTIDIDVDLPALEILVPGIGSLFASEVGRRATEAIHTLVEVDLPAALNAQRLKFGRVISDVFAGRDRKILSFETDHDGIVWQFIDDERDPLPTLPPEVASPSLLEKVDNIVVVMMENRSFDHMLGYLKRDKERKEVDGLNAPDANGNTGQWNTFGNEQFQPHRLTGTRIPADVDPCHDVGCVAAQIGLDGGMHGFVESFHRRLQEHPGARAVPTDVIGYFGAEQVWAYDRIAEHYAICDRWFASHPGPTWPNRYFLISGHLGPSTEGGPDVDMTGGPTPIRLDTIFDELTRRNVSWSYFEHDIGFLRKVEQYSLDFERIVDIDDPQRGFFARAARGDLPSVTFIDPNFVDFPDGRVANDDHPPTDITPGQVLIARIYNALRNSPQWTKSLFVVIYDEHGGFYDHCPPPTAPAPPGSLATLGVRVPAMLVSPWIAPGHVEHTVFDHTAVAKTIFRRFAPESLPAFSERFTNSPDLGVVLTLERPRTDALPEIAAPATVHSSARSEAAPVAESDILRRSLIGLKAFVDQRRPR